MKEDLEKPLLDFDIDKAVEDLENQYKAFMIDIQAIDSKLARLEDKRDFEKIETM
jgi:predicted  nucleic acid-binding Zn-ribbon protein